VKFKKSCNLLSRWSTDQRDFYLACTHTNLGNYYSIDQIFWRPFIHEHKLITVGQVFQLQINAVRVNNASDVAKSFTSDVEHRQESTLVRIFAY